MHSLRLSILGMVASVLTGAAAVLLPAPARAQPWTFQRIQNYPFESDYDLRKVREGCDVLRKQLSGQFPRRDSPARKSLEGFLDEVQAFTDTANRPGQAYSIEDFATSSDKAIVRLRDEVKLKPPPGGAILRLYDTKDAMPPPIRALFTSSVGGVTRWGRYCAVWAEGKSDQELEDTTAHELTHAYIASYLGPDAGKLPRWFHEGAAMYLSGAKSRYITPDDYGSRISYSPKDYNEYRIVFAYIAAKYSAAEAAHFIRASVQRQSVAGPLKAITGYTSYARLRRDALDWSSLQKIGYYPAAAGFVLTIAGVSWFVSTRRRRRIQKALALVEEARTLARSGLRDQALQNLSLARTTEPYALPVRLAVQQAEKEIGPAWRAFPG